MSQYVLPDISDSELLGLEAKIQEAQKRRSLDGLKVYGFGEVSIALGWPIDEPRFVAKRMIPMPTAASLEGPLQAIDRFADEIWASGGKVLPYQTRLVQRPDGQYVGYLVQPIVPPDELAETVLKTDEPTASHPLLVAVRDFVMTCATKDMALDAQLPNFAWVDSELWLLDISSPAGFDADDNLIYPNMPLANQLVPFPLRPALAKASADVLSLYRGTHNALTQVVVFLHRIKADAWVEPAIETFNQVLDKPIDRHEVNRRWEQNTKDFPKIKKLLQLQRSWQETVRRKPYEYLITDSFTGEVI